MPNDLADTTFELLSRFTTCYKESDKGWSLICQQHARACIDYPELLPYSFIYKGYYGDL